MKPIIVEFDNSSEYPLYIQLYRSIRNDIISGAMSEGLVSLLHSLHTTNCWWKAISKASPSQATMFLR